MEFTKLSTKGQIILPKTVRDSQAWEPGTEFTVEKMGDGVLLRPVPQVPETTLDQVFGCLKYAGKPKTIAQMKAGIAREIRRRHDSGRY